jgi:Uma2 family endonuclease
MSAVDFAPELLEPAQFTRHRVTVADYHRMAEAGVLAPDARVELIEGEVIDMAPMGTRHWHAVQRLNRLLLLATLDRAEVACQLPLRLGDFSEPEPDAVVFRPLLSADSLPTGRDALLVVEVSDSTLSFDARIKAELYARHGVLEYWVVDLVQQRLLRFADAQDGQWQTAQALPRPTLVGLPGLDDVQVDLGPLF